MSSLAVTVSAADAIPSPPPTPLSKPDNGHSHASSSSSSSLSSIADDNDAGTRSGAREDDDEDMDNEDIQELEVEEYEQQRLANIRERDALLSSLGFGSGSTGSARLPNSSTKINGQTTKSKSKLPPTSEELRRRKESKAKEAALRRAVEPTRRSGRVAARIEAEAEAGADDTSNTSSPRITRTSARTRIEPSPKPRIPQLPKAVAPTLIPGPSYSPSPSSSSTSTSKPKPKSYAPAPKPTRGQDGRLIFEGRYRDVFAPNLTPEEMFKGGAFAGAFFADTYSHVLRAPLASSTDISSLPFTLSNPTKLLSNPSPDGELNRFKVRAGQSLQEWEKAGWIWAQDPRGWAQWYVRFWEGRRCEDDDRQVRRWLKVAGPTGRFKRALLKKVHGSGGLPALADEDVGRVLRQCLWQWGYEMTQSEYERAIAGE